MSSNNPIELRNYGDTKQRGRDIALDLAFEYRGTRELSELEQWLLKDK